MHCFTTHRATSLPLEVFHPSILTGYSLMFQDGTLCRVTTHDLRADDAFHLANAPVEVLRRSSAADFRAPMERDEIPWRNIEIECGMELAVLSKTGQHQVGPTAGFPKIRANGSAPSPGMPVRQLHGIVAERIFAMDARRRRKVQGPSGDPVSFRIFGRETPQR